MSKRYKRHRDYAFFAQDISLNKLSELGDSLPRLEQGIDFEILGVLLEGSLSKHLIVQTYI